MKHLMLFEDFINEEKWEYRKGFYSDDDINEKGLNKIASEIDNFLKSTETVLVVTYKKLKFSIISELKTRYKDVISFFEKTMPINDAYNIYSLHASNTVSKSDRRPRAVLVDNYPKFNEHLEKLSQSENTKVIIFIDFVPAVANDKIKHLKV
jgi:hypothetical protein